MVMTFVSEQDTYSVLRELGRGGMGTTYLVRSESSDEVLVLKQLHLSLAEDWTVIDLFRREGSILKSLSHPHIPRYIDFFEAADQSDLFLVQSYVEGKTIRQMMHEKETLSPNDFVSYLSQSLDILDYLHSLVPPVLHRDITPQNIIIRQPQGSRSGEVFLVDFSAVKNTSIDSEPDLEASIGTFGYMSPEQMLGQADQSSDLFSLGMTFISLEAGMDISKLQKNEETGRIESSTLLKRFPAYLRQLLEDMTKPNRHERISSAREALDILHKKKKRRTPFALYLTGVVLFTLFFSIWGISLLKENGEIRTLGGWFSGHGTFLSAVTATCFGKVNLISKGSPVTRIAFSPTGEQLLSATDGGEFILWDCRSGGMLHRFSDERLTKIQWILFLPSHDTAALANEKYLIFYDTHTWTEKKSVRMKEKRLLHCSLLDDNRLVAVFHSRQDAIHLSSLTDDGEEIIVSTDAGKVESVINDPTGSWICIKEDQGLLDHRLYLWDLSSNIKSVIEEMKRMYDMTFSLDGSFLAYTDKNTITLMNLLTREKYHHEDFSSFSRVIEFSPDSQKLYIVPIYQKNQVKVFTLDKEKLSFIQESPFGPKHRSEILDIAFSPDGSILATASEDQRVTLWKKDAF